MSLLAGLVTVGFVEAAGAAITATAAVGMYGEVRRARRAITGNTRRSKAADARSIGNRRFLRWMLPFAVDGVDERRQPAEFDPDPDAAVRTDGGNTNDA